MHKPVDLLHKAAQWDNIGGNGDLAHFYHANGFPAGVYEPLLSSLKENFSLKALHIRPTWLNIGLPPNNRSWQLYADDLISFIEREYNSAIVGIGHSMGASATILAALKRPDLFKALILIEPAMVSPSIATMARLLPKSMMNRIQPAKGTLTKKDSWENREDFLEYCKQHKLYKNFSDSSLISMAKSGVIDSQNGSVTLAFPKIWEAHNYTQPPAMMAAIKQLKMPCVAIRGKPSIFFTEKIWQQWKAISPQTIFLENTGYGHLMPLENPTVCSELIIRGFNEITKQQFTL